MLAKNLPEVRRHADELIVYDNTAHDRGYRIVAHFIGGELNLLLMPDEHVLWRDVADGTVQTHVVVMLYVTLHQTPRIFERQRRPGPCTSL